MKIRMMKINKVMALCAAVITLSIGFSSCEKEEPEVPLTEADIQIRRTELNVSGDGGKVYTGVTSSQEWKITEIDAPWLTASVSEGAAGVETKITFTAAASDVKEERKATVTITSGASQATLKVIQDQMTIVLDPSTIDVSKIYIPQELQNTDFYKSSSTWYFGRSKQSEHFIILWGRGYGDYGDKTPSEAGSRYRVDIDATLKKAEECYDLYTGDLAFVEAEKGKSNVDKYKIMIFLHYTTEWMAYGGGKDDIIGAIWLNPTTLQPVASTLCHELGHAFQYQIYCDQLKNGQSNNYKRSFRYNTGTGSAYWEQTAQWQAYQFYPDEPFNSYHFATFLDNQHRHYLHEEHRYANCFFNWYMTDTYGIDAVGKVWNQAVSPKDALEVYQDVFDISLEEFNAQIYDYSAKIATWDIDALRSHGKNYQNRFTWKYSKTEDGYLKVDKSKCLEATGQNIIRLKLSPGGTELSTELVGLPNEPGYNKVKNASIAGWTYGYVALLNDGTRVYSEPTIVTAETELKGVAKFTIPNSCSKLWLIVAATPTKYMTHLWDDNNDNDEQWPYKIKIEGTTLY